MHAVGKTSSEISMERRKQSKTRGSQDDSQDQVNKVDLFYKKKHSVKSRSRVSAYRWQNAKQRVYALLRCVLSRSCSLEKLTRQHRTLLLAA